MKEQDTADREVAAGFAELLERRGTSSTDGEDEMGSTTTRSAAGARPTTAMQIEVTGWLPPIVSLSSDDLALLVTEMLQLNADLVTAIAAEGLEATNPLVAFMRVDVASRSTRWAALLLDRARKMGSLTTGEIPAVHDATGKAIENLK